MKRLGKVLAGAGLALALVGAAHARQDDIDINRLRGSLDQTRETIRSLVPSARMRVIEGSGHWVQYEAAPQVNLLLGDL